jgi:hypothetical protein
LASIPNLKWALEASLNLSLLFHLKFYIISKINPIGDKIPKPDMDTLSLA